MNADIAKIIFLLPVSLIIISIPLIIIEDNGTRLFQGFYYRYGISIYKTTIDIGNLPILPGEKKVITKEEGCFCFTDDGKIYFRSNPAEFNWFRVRTLFPYKMTASITDMNHLLIVAKLPLGPTLLLLNWSILGILLIPLSRSVGSLFAVSPLIMFFIGYPFEQSRMKKMITELKEIIASYNRDRFFVGATVDER